tara:strand:+ start:678 stop:908 length:231 start_codon:yes stop_codon:yes gene_type:complete
MLPPEEWPETVNVGSVELGAEKAVASGSSIELSMVGLGNRLVMMSRAASRCAATLCGYRSRDEASRCAGEPTLRDA